MFFALVTPCNCVTAVVSDEGKDLVRMQSKRESKLIQVLNAPD